MKNGTIIYYPKRNDRTVSYPISVEVGRKWVYADMSQFGYGPIAFLLDGFKCNFLIHFMDGEVFLLDYKKF